MKILIGTPIHACKDYSMKSWLQNVAKLQKETPVDLLLVDNSPGTDYLEKVKGYCKKFGIKNYGLKHFEVKNANLNPDLVRSVNVEISQEIIRRHTIKQDYDAWFSWECDQIIPENTLNQLIAMMSAGKYMMVVVNSWARETRGELNANMGVTLISSEALKMSWFLPDKKGKISLELKDFYQNGEISFDLADFYNVDETMFKKRILRSGGNYVEIYGVIEPIYHLNN